MLSKRSKWAALAIMSGGMLLQSGCDVTQAILTTIGYALQIANIWV